MWVVAAIATFTLGAVLMSFLVWLRTHFEDLFPQQIVVPVAVLALTVLLAMTLYLIARQIGDRGLDG